jgi:hypothetical protein
MPFSRMSVVSARVSRPQSPMMPRLEPLIEMAGGAEVRRLGDVGAQDDAARARRRRHVDGLDVFVVGSHIADMWKGEGDDLAGIGRIGEDLLIARHGGVEADLAHGEARGAEAESFQHGAVRQYQERGGFPLGPAGIVLFGAHQGPR